MTPTDALAAAIRERLVAGRPAPLPGLGTLVRQHVSARVEERPDGSRVLLPPGETIGLTPTDADQETLASSYAQFRGVPPGGAEAAFAEAMDQVEARLAATGEVRLPSVGLLRRTSGGVVLGVEADLLAAVNRTYEGLTPVQASPRAAAPATPPAEPEPTDAPPADEPSDVFEDVAPPPPDEPLAPGEDAVAADVFQEESFADDAADQDPADEDSAADDVADAALADDNPADGPPPELDYDDEDDEPVELFDDTPDDEVVAVPFGGDDAEPLADLLPPTPEAPAADAEPNEAASTEDAPADAEPAADEPAETEAVTDEPVEPARPDVAAETADDEDDWLSSTWVAPRPEPPPDTLDAADDETLEDAELVEDDEPVELFDDEVEENAAPSPTADRIEPEASDEETADADALPEPAPVAEDPTPAAPPLPPDVVIERVEPAPPPVGPPDERPSERVFEPVVPGAYVGPDGLVTSAPPERPRVQATPPAEPAPERTGSRWGWIAALAALTLVVIALAIVWNQDRDAATDAGTDVAAGGAPLVADEPIEDEPADALADEAPDAPAEPLADDAEPAPAEPAPPAEAPASAAPARASGAGAVLPPRLAGLPDADRAALSGPAVEAGADVWTLVVFSTTLRDVARANQTRYREAGYRTSVVESSVGGRTWYRVTVGQFTSEADAHRLRDRLPPQAPPDTWALDLSTL